MQPDESYQKEEEGSLPRREWTQYTDSNPLQKDSWTFENTSSDVRTEFCSVNLRKGLTNLEIYNVGVYLVSDPLDGG